MQQNSSALPSEVVIHTRNVERLITGLATSDGAGVKLTRVLTQDLQRRLDPFLMLDAFRSDDPNDYIGGFPNHPHRGFETVTYMIAGRLRHRDSVGHAGLLQNGGVQWMTAGRGLIHSEMPEQEDGVMEGFQLWLNLPAKDKMSTPWYKDYPSEEIPEFVTENGVTVRVIAGSSHGVTGAVTRQHTDPLYLDIHLAAGQTYAQTLPEDHNAFIYVYRGNVILGETAVPEKRMAILENTKGADGVILRADGPAKALLICGKPLHEAIVQHGPFVMNTEQEIYAAVADYQSGRLTTG